MGRIEKINRQIKKEVGSIIQWDLGDPRLQFVTITAVDVSKDLHHAKVSFSVLGDASQRQAAQMGLDRAKGMIRRLLGERIDIRYTPALFFVYDKTVEMSARIERTLKEIHHEHESDHTHPKEE